MVYFVKNKEDFDRQVAAADGKLVVVDFFAIWCGPSVSVDPELEELAAKYVNKIVVMKVDVDKCEDLADQYKAECVPKFIFLNKGCVVSEFSGAIPGKLEETVVQFMGRNSCSRKRS